MLSPSPVSLESSQFDLLTPNAPNLLTANQFSLAKKFKMHIHDLQGKKPTMILVYNQITELPIDPISAGHKRGHRHPQGASLGSNMMHFLLPSLPP
jgi:hypothetical protein